MKKSLNVKFLYVLAICLCLLVNLTGCSLIQDRSGNFSDDDLQEFIDAINSTTGDVEETGGTPGDEEIIPDSQAAAYLNKTLSDIKQEFGETEDTGMWQGTHYLHYRDKGIVFHFQEPSEDQVVVAVDLLENSEISISGVSMGDSLSQVKNTLGQPMNEGVDELEGTGYILTYNLDGVMVFFSADSADGPVKKAMLKKE